MLQDNVTMLRQLSDELQQATSTDNMDAAKAIARKIDEETRALASAVTQAPNQQQQSDQPQPGQEPQPDQQDQQPQEQPQENQDQPQEQHQG
jgi:hypothetical protein